MELEYTGFRPQSADEREPELSLDKLLIRNRSAAFFAVMHGNAMWRAGIRHGDVLVIEAAEHYPNGAIVLAFIDHKAIVRRLERAGDGYALVAAHTKVLDVAVTADCVIRGQVVAAVTLLARPRVKLAVVN